MREQVFAGILACALVLIEAGVPRAQQQSSVAGSAGPKPLVVLVPTPHPSIARDPGNLWLVPSDTGRSAATANAALVRLKSGIKLYSQGKNEQALAQLSTVALAPVPLADYATYYMALTELRMERFEAARRRFHALNDSHPAGYVSQASALGEAEAADGLHDYGAAVRIYEELLKRKPIGEDGIWLNLATVAAANDDRVRAAEAYLRLYYEFPLSSLAVQAEWPLATMREVQPINSGNARYKFELGRAERLFGSRRYADARTSFLRLQPYAGKGDSNRDDAALVALRLAECDYYTARYGVARDALLPHLTRGARQAEARFFYLMAQKGLKANESFVQLVRALVSDFPDSTWSEEALNNLASYHIVVDRDDEADSVFREMSARFPRGRYAERAAWRIGWRAYRQGQFDEAARTFEAAAAAFPRADYRPSFLYWAARAREAIGDRAIASQRYLLVTLDYQNSYYGRLATAALSGRADRAAADGVALVTFAQPGRAAAAAATSESANRGAAASGAPRALSKDGQGEDDEVLQPPNAEIIRSLLALELYDEALSELQSAQRTWGDSPLIRATMAWTQQQKGRAATGTERFTLLRGAITTMRQAYPQFMAAGGETLPRELLTVIFPIAYWDLIQKHSAARGLDPYLVAALVAQESTFVADIRSSAQAVGLMQLLPSTGRAYARKLKLRYSADLLTNPDANVRMGTAYFADKIREFGDVHLALASYNAGERAVRGWLAERPGLPRDEFIDDIPYPETQNYVKRILGTAEDYRRLYGNR